MRKIKLITPKSLIFIYFNQGRLGPSGPSGPSGPFGGRLGPYGAVGCVAGPMAPTLLFTCLYCISRKFHLERQNLGTFGVLLGVLLVKFLKEPDVKKAKSRAILVQDA